jgi:GT2 family glycosyltransferase
MPPINRTYRAGQRITDVVITRSLPSVSIIVVGYKSRHHLSRCFTSLLLQDYAGSFEIFYVDNASPDGSAEFVRSVFPGILVLESARNLGYAAGNNFGAAHAYGRILVFLNPDTKTSPSWLTELIRPLIDDPTIGLTTSKILLMNEPETINTCGNEVSLAGITWCRGTGRPATEYAEDEDVAATSGCAFAIWRDLFQRLGGFDERFFMYLEDTDLSLRARAAGYRCRFAASSIVYHDYHLSLTPAKIAFVERNRYLMLGKHLSLRSLVALAPEMALAEVLTWGYAALNGRATLAAKARSTAWAFVHLWPVLRAPWQPIEGQMLRSHQCAPPVIAAKGATPVQTVQVAIGNLSRFAAKLTMKLLPAPPADSASTPIRDPVTSWAGWRWITIAPLTTESKVGERTLIRAGGHVWDDDPV